VAELVLDACFIFHGAWEMIEEGESRDGVVDDRVARFSFCCRSDDGT